MAYVKGNLNLRASSRLISLPGITPEPQIKACAGGTRRLSGLSPSMAVPQHPCAVADTTCAEHRCGNSPARNEYAPPLVRVACGAARVYQAIFGSRSIMTARYAANQCDPSLPTTYRKPYHFASWKTFLPLIVPRGTVTRCAAGGYSFRRLVYVAISYHAPRCHARTNTYR